MEINMWNSLGGRQKNIICIIIGVASLTAFAAMMIFARNFVTNDTQGLKIWWDYLADRGVNGIFTISEVGGDYTTIWYFIMLGFINAGIYPSVNVEICLESLSIAGTLLSAVSVFFIARFFHKDSALIPTVTALAILFLPAFMGDILKSNMPDTLYLMFSLFSFLCLIHGKRCLTWFFLGMGICLKMMSVYLLPLYAYLWVKDLFVLRKKSRLFCFISPVFAVAAAVLCSLPYKLAGGGWEGGILAPLISRGGAGMRLNGLNLSAFLPNDAANFRWFSLALTGIALAAVFAFTLLFVPTQRQRAVEYALLPSLTVMICYYFMPAQHEGYFALATVLSLIGLISEKNKSYFILFTMLNVIMFLGYIWISFGYGNEYSYYTRNSENIVLFLAGAFSVALGYACLILWKEKGLKTV